MRAALFCANPYAFGILKPLHDKLHNSNHNVLWYVPEKHLLSFPYTETVNLTTSIEELHRFSSDAIFVPGNEVPHYLRGVKVQIFHGLCGEKKGHFRIRHYFDLYLTQGPYFTKRFSKLASKHKDFQVKETGWCKLDPLFKSNPKIKDEKNSILGSNAKQHLVLYAPTFSPSLTSAITLKDHFFELAKNQDAYLMVKFHDLMHKDVVAEYERIAKTYSNVEIISDRNILKYLIMADIMISDTSSVVYEFVFLNKPAITLNSKSPNIVWKNITNPNMLNDAFAETISNDTFSGQRNEIISQYHPYTDGESSQRMIEAAEEYIYKFGVPVKRKLNLYRKYKMIKYFGSKPRS